MAGFGLCCLSDAIGPPPLKRIVTHNYLRLRFVTNMNIPLLILCSIALLAVVLKVCGKKGLSSVLLLLGVLLVKDAARRLWGHTAEWIVVGLFGVPCVAIYIIRRQRRGQHGSHKHHAGAPHDHVA